MKILFLRKHKAVLTRRGRRIERKNDGLILQKKKRWGNAKEHMEQGSGEHVLMMSHQASVLKDNIFVGTRPDIRNALEKRSAPRRWIKRFLRNGLMWVNTLFKAFWRKRNQMYTKLMKKVS